MDAPAPTFSDVALHQIALFEKMAATHERVASFDRLFADMAWVELPGGCVRKSGGGAILTVGPCSISLEQPGYYLEVFL